MAGVTQGDTERAQGLDLLFQYIHTSNQTDIQGRCFLKSELHLMKDGRVTPRNLTVGVETAPEGCDNHNGGKRIQNDMNICGISSPTASCSQFFFSLLFIQLLTGYSDVFFK